MFYNVLKVKDIVHLDGEKLKRHTLLQNGTNSFSLIALSKDGTIDTHTSENDTAIYVLDGEIEIHFEAEKFTLDKGEILMFKKDKQHKVFAKKDTHFFLIKI
jgi:quercetin dioxygenase-like cupin family protein